MRSGKASATRSSPYLANEPVVAAAPSAIYRLRKFARRNRVIVAAGSAVALTLITGIAVSSWQADRAKRALAETETARQQAIAGEKKAKAQVREASRSDAATAQARLAEGKWQEGVAYLGRAIRYDPDNQNAQNALWLAVRYGKPDAGRLPIYSLKHENFVEAPPLARTAAAG